MDNGGSRFFSGIWHGAAWYPELWPDRVDEDLRLMADAGINLVRVGEFAWSTLEPEENRYELAWLHQVMDKCQAANIGVVLCTPTPTPPRWLTARYPEVLRVDGDGLPFGHGSRQHVSHTSEKYREFSRGITDVLAREFGRHPALVAWQTDNEFLCHVWGDYGASTERAWHAWLQDKYTTIENLNQTWSTAIWSEDYPAFELVPMPQKTPFDNRIGIATGTHHVSLAADWLRFTSDTVVRFQDEQLAILRAHSPAPITHNQIAQTRVYNEDLFENLDSAATDFYTPHDAIWRTFRTLDWMRGAKMRPDGTTVPYAILETSPSHNGARHPGHLTHPHGFLRAEALLFLGMGGNTFAYWLWRQQRSGVEMCHGSVITAWGTPSVGWKDVQDVSALIEAVEPILTGTAPARAQVALHESKNAHALLQSEPLWNDLNPGRASEQTYKPLLEMGLWRDVRFESADVQGYQVVLSPFMPGLSDALVDRMTAFVENGGTWVVGPTSGCRTVYGTVPTDAGLGRLDALAGVRSLYPVGIHSCRGSLRDSEVTLGGYSFGLEPIHPDCEVLGRYLDGPGEGTAWCVGRTLGQGRIVLLAAHAPNHYGTVLEALLRDTPLQRFDASWGTTIIPREGNNQRAYLIANWDGNGGTVTLPEGGRDLITQKPISSGSLTVEPFGVHAVLCE